MYYNKIYKKLNTKYVLTTNNSNNNITLIHFHLTAYFWR